MCVCVCVCVCVELELDALVLMDGQMRQLQGGYRDGCWMTLKVVSEDPMWNDESIVFSY